MAATYMLICFHFIVRKSHSDCKHNKNEGLQHSDTLKPYNPVPQYRNVHWQILWQWLVFLHNDKIV